MDFFFRRLFNDQLIYNEHFGISAFRHFAFNKNEWNEFIDAHRGHMFVYSIFASTGLYFMHKRILCRYFDILDVRNVFCITQRLAAHSFLLAFYAQANYTYFHQPCFFLFFNWEICHLDRSFLRPFSFFAKSSKT